MRTILVSILASAASLEGTCLSAPVLGPTGSFYDVIASPGIAWTDANAAAGAMTYGGAPGHLVTITSATEDAFVNALVASLGFGEVWAGGYQDPVTESDPTAGWTWVNGEGPIPGVDSVVPYADWAGVDAYPIPQPDDAYGAASEQYLGLNLWGPARGWNDEGNLSLIGGYVVEFTAVIPESNTWLVALGLGVVLALAGWRRGS